MNIRLLEIKVIFYVLLTCFNFTSFLCIVETKVLKPEIEFRIFVIQYKGTLEHNAQFVRKCVNKRGRKYILIVY